MYLSLQFTIYVSMFLLSTRSTAITINCTSGAPSGPLGLSFHSCSDVCGLYIHPSPSQRKVSLNFFIKCWQLCMHQWHIIHVCRAQGPQGKGGPLCSDTHFPHRVNNNKSTTFSWGLAPSDGTGIHGTFLHFWGAGSSS